MPLLCSRSSTKSPEPNIDQCRNGRLHDERGQRCLKCRRSSSMPAATLMKCGCIALGLISKVEPFTEEQAKNTGTLFREDGAVRTHSLGAGSCLALAIAIKSSLYTADKAWLSLKLAYESVFFGKSKRGVNAAVVCGQREASSYASSAKRTRKSSSG